MSFKAVTVLKLLIEEYRRNSKKIAEIVESMKDSSQIRDWSFEYTKGLLTSKEEYSRENQKILLILRQAGIDIDRPLEEQILTIDRTRALCDRRGWPSDWQSRMAYLVEEASEYFSALRGKGSQDVVGEGGDLLNCVYATLGISNIDPVEFENRMVAKINELWDAPRRPGELFETRPKPTRLTPGWVTDSDRPLESSAIWILTPSGEVYPGFYKKEKIAGVWWTSWYWEDGEQVKSFKNVAGWMLREFDRPALELTDEEVEESDSVQDDNEA